jgi:transposase InsO family protein
VHHSDCGSQYASNDYTDLLKVHGIQISMSRKGNPWDNAAVEWFMKTLKYEEVLRNEYRDLTEFGDLRRSSSLIDVSGSKLIILGTARQVVSCTSHAIPGSFTPLAAVGRVK